MPPRKTQGPELLFVGEPSQIVSWTGVVQRLQHAACQRFGARLFDTGAAIIATQLAAKFGASFGVLGPKDGFTPRNVQILSPDDVDAVLLIGGDAEQVSAALLDYLDESRLTVVAPVTEKHWQKLPLYLISIPKAGTHLLFRLAEALGYTAAGVSPERPSGGHWYYLLNSNAHTSANEFFCDKLQEAPFGNRAHPFMRSPALFNYRNPLDILVSEASYWHVDGNSPLSVILSPLTFEQRVDRLIDDRWLLGTIRDRVGSFATWLDCSNVIPVSFEEMVGKEGGGSNEALERLIWSIQLKLHVPGKPESIRQLIPGRSSPTFREGKINGWRQQLSVSALKQFEALPQDFMQKYGYDSNLSATGDILPAHAAAFRRRPLRLSAISHTNMPFLVETDYLGYNIVAYDDRYYAIDIATGDLDITQLSPEQRAKFLNAHSLASLHNMIAVAGLEQSNRIAAAGLDQRVRAQVTTLVNAYLSEEKARLNNEMVGAVRAARSFLGYNVIRRDDAVLALPRRLGAVDPRDYGLRSRPGVIISNSAAGVRLRILWEWVRWAYWDGAKF